MTLLEKQLTEQVEQLTETVSTLNQTIVELQQTIAELREQLNKNSRNSSKPPSSDGYKKPKPKSLRESSGRKAGGQDGHEGHHLNIEQTPKEIISHMPSGCAGCPLYEKCRGEACVAETRKVADAAIEIHVTAHEALAVTCPLTGKALRGSFPEDVKGPIQYGKKLQGLIVAFNTIGAVSANRIKEIFGSVFGIPLSTGTVNSMVVRFAGGLDGVMAEIRDQVSGGSVAHFDETGTSVNGRLHWAHVASNDRFTYLYLSAKRGKAGMDEGDVLPRFRGTKSVAICNFKLVYFLKNEIMNCDEIKHIIPKNEYDNEIKIREEEKKGIESKRKEDKKELTELEKEKIDLIFFKYSRLNIIYNTFMVIKQKKMKIFILSLIQFLISEFLKRTK